MSSSNSAQRERVELFLLGRLDAALSKHCIHYTIEATVSACTAHPKQQQSQLSQFTAVQSLTRGH